MMQQIARETGAKVGGTLYSDALSDAGGPAATYLEMMRNNISEFAKALMP
jgi:zinc/manganese transport system substrate-binding protein